MRRFVVAFSLVLVVLIGLGVRAVLTPPEADVPIGDAMIVHDGGHGERLNAALALAANGAAPVMVVMNGAETEWPGGRSLCDQTDPYIVICPTAEPANTSGEASEMGDLVVEQGWRRLVIVTSDYHLRRALMLDEKCAGDAALLGVGAPADIGALRRVLLVAREVAALPHAWLSGC